MDRNYLDLQVAIIVVAPQGFRDAHAACANKRDVSAKRMWRLLKEG
jgi:hypothetical protein